MADSAKGAGADYGRRNYSLILSSGVAATTARQLVNPTLVLPFLYLALDAPVVVAGLLLPIMKGASLFAEMVSAPFLNKSTRAKYYVVAPTLLSAGALAAIAWLAEGAPPLVVVTLFLAIALLIGLCKGVTTIGLGQLFGVAVPSHRRSTITFTTAMAGGLVAILVVVAARDFLASDQPMQRHITVLWAGIAASIVGALFMFGVRLIEDEEAPKVPAPKAEPTQPVAKRIIAELREGMRTGIHYAWFRRYILARFLFLSVTLALPFLTIHASSYHKGTPHGLSILVVAASAGIVVGAFCWGWLSSRSNKLVMIVATLVGTSALVLALVLDFTGLITHVELYAITVFLVAVAGTGIINGRYLYFIDMTKKKERPSLMALSDLVVGLVAIAVASVLGIVAHYADPTVPLMVLLVVSLIAAFFAAAFVVVPHEGEKGEPDGWLSHFRHGHHGHDEHL